MIASVIVFCSSGVESSAFDDWPPDPRSVILVGMRSDYLELVRSRINVGGIGVITGEHLESGAFFGNNPLKDFAGYAGINLLRKQSLNFPCTKSAGHRPADSTTGLSVIMSRK